MGLGFGAALIAVGMAAGVTAAAQNTNDGQRPFRAGRMGGPMRPGGPGMGLLGMIPIQRLHLTDAQKDQVKGILDSKKEEFKALGDRARVAHTALQAAMTADELNDAAIRQASAQVAAVEADMAVAGAHARAEVLQILTADQRAELKKLQAERPGRGPGGPGGRGGRGQR
jgi:Spy/CpxP family protein refolding chaperone